MIALASECLLVELPGGEAVPCSAEMVSVELAGENAASFDAEFINHATKAVFHYFKNEAGRRSVAVNELAEALQKVLQGFALTLKPESHSPLAKPRVLESDLRRLALDSGEGCELAFFPRLRDELRRHLKEAPKVLRFRGLRGCVKHLTGAQRWSGRCRNLEQEIVGYIRQCLSTEAAPSEFALLVE